MKNYFYIAVVATVVLSSCSKEDLTFNDNQQHQQPEQQFEAPVFTATIEGNDMTRTQLAEGSTAGKKKVNWLSTDKVFVSSFATDKPLLFGEYSVAPDSEDPTTATMTLDGAAHYYNNSGGVPVGNVAIYPASIAAQGTLSSEQISTSDFSQLVDGASAIFLPGTQTYLGDDISYIAPMMAANTGGTDFHFVNLTALLAITVPYSQMTSVKKITVSADKRLNGYFVADLKNYYQLNQKAIPCNYEKTIDLLCNCNTLASNTAIPAGGSVTFYVSIPANSYKYLKIQVTDGTITKTMRTSQSATINAVRNKIYSINFIHNQTDYNLLPGEFSVSNTKKVQFTKGNLYCDAHTLSEPIYHFESYQNATSVTLGQTKYDANHVCHFFWTRYQDLWTAGATTSKHYPYADEYEGHNNDTKTDVFFCGEGNKFTVDGTAGLYSLSKEEWEYLFARSGKYAYGVTVQTSAGTVENCVVIAPDACLNDYTFDSTKKSYTSTEWITAEAAGLVCLPAGGYRYGVKDAFNQFVQYTVIGSQFTDKDWRTIITNGSGYYWSSTPHESEEDEAYCLDFGSDHVYYTVANDAPNHMPNYNRYYACSVRLVKSL